MEYVSKEKYEELQKELKELKTKKRKEIAEQLEYAKALGDISENAEYNQAREDQARTEDRISKLEKLLQGAEVVGKHTGGIVEVGVIVSIEKDGSGKEQKYQIVGSEESNMKEGKISHQSPIGSALLGKKKGDKVNIKTPKGVVQYIIRSIE